MTRHRTLAVSVGLAALIAVTSCSDKSDKTEPPAPTGNVDTAPATSTPPSATTALGTATLTAPMDGAKVRQCEIFSGVADLPADKTLLLGVRNLDSGSPERYFEPVQDWEYPTDLKQWKGAQYFGSKDSAVGQHFRAELLIINLDQATKLLAAGKKDGLHSQTNPTGSTVAAHITLERIAGPGPSECS